jgi:hypothetical protein
MKREKRKGGGTEGMNGGLFLFPSGMTPVGGVENGGGGVDQIMRCLPVEFGWAIGRSIGWILGAFIPV